VGSLGPASSATLTIVADPSPAAPNIIVVFRAAGKDVLQTHILVQGPVLHHANLANLALSPIL